MSNYMLLSEYSGSDKYSNRKAEVLRCVENNNFGIRMYIEGESLGIEWYEGHSEAYAESAAENYVVGIKDYERTI
mgnify:CR=1 FL=1